MVLSLFSLPKNRNDQVYFQVLFFKNKVAEDNHEYIRLIKLVSIWIAVDSLLSSAPPNWNISGWFGR